MMTQIATNKDKSIQINLKPLLIEVLATQKPEMSILKMMIASKKSSEGVAKVYKGWVQQSDLTSEKIASKLTVIEGDLGTCLNLNRLHAQRKPEKLPKESLSNMFTLIGGAHNLWNFAQAFATLDFGESSDSKDLGFWNFFEALSIKSSQFLN